MANYIVTFADPGTQAQVAYQGPDFDQACDAFQVASRDGYSTTLSEDSVSLTTISRYPAPHPTQAEAAEFARRRRARRA